MKKYRVILHSDHESFPNWWLIQEKGLFSDWRYNCGPFPTEAGALDFIENGIKKNQKLHIGNTSNCVYCGKPMDENSGVGCGSVIKDGYAIVGAKFCNQMCLRNISYKIPNWCHSEWIDDYGIKLHDFEPFYL